MFKIILGAFKKIQIGAKELVQRASDSLFYDNSGSIHKLWPIRKT